MKKNLFLVLLITFSLLCNLCAYAQTNSLHFCSTPPVGDIPARTSRMNVKGEIYVADSLKPIQEELEKWMKQFQSIPFSKTMDSTSSYKMQFEEKGSWREEYNGVKSNTYTIIKHDTIIQGKDLYAYLTNSSYLRYYHLHPYTYGNFLVIKACDEYIGNRSWGWNRIFYFAKQ